VGNGPTDGTDPSGLAEIQAKGKIADLDAQVDPADGTPYKDLAAAALTTVNAEPSYKNRSTQIAGPLESLGTVTALNKEFKIGNTTIPAGTLKAASFLYYMEWDFKEKPDITKVKLVLNEVQRASLTPMGGKLEVGPERPKFKNTEVGLNQDPVLTYTRVVKLKNGMYRLIFVDMPGNITNVKPITNNAGKLLANPVAKTEVTTADTSVKGVEGSKLDIELDVTIEGNGMTKVTLNGKEQ
jgi:hypothetical protein